MRSTSGRVLSFSTLSLLALDAVAHTPLSNHAATHHARAHVLARDDSHAFVDSVTLTPPGIPSPPPATAFDLALPASPAGLSIPHSGSFMGFSVEFSVSSQVRACLVSFPRLFGFRMLMGLFYLLCFSRKEGVSELVQMASCATPG
jgi:hypothetical protein